MEWLRISTSTELVRVATDEIVYVRADGNYSDLVERGGSFFRQFILITKEKSWITTNLAATNEFNSDKLI